ncbi:alpha/beta fold hydrolase [Evansella sp. AB-P1]|uniref:alpha/beta hydrolase n=1 Tax=Evansella sp. AB-P1 TaxID=3037653 RepID=UPI00241D4369|nr:alpha/beta fold hydrolase [Evansella sp. AB-P1]MDG5788449.1 alpha/beta fold hydrolase [Evansella sp. AB-P1]
MKNNEFFKIIQGAESFHYDGNSTGILICHGFLGTPQSMEYLGQAFANKGYTVRAPRLRGHGTHYFDLEKATFTDWIHELEENYLQLKDKCSQVFVLGQSMGGLLSLLIASKFKDVSGVITINVAFEVPDYEQYRNKLLPNYIEEGPPDINNKEVKEITYPYVPLKSINELLKLIDFTKDQITSIKSPVLLMHSKVDNVVPPISSKIIYERLKTTKKELVQLNNSCHVASMDFDQDKIVIDTDRFITSIVNFQYELNHISTP